MSSLPCVPRLQRGKFVAQGMQACWRCYEGSGLRLHDVSGRDNHGTLTNGATFTNGRSGSCLSLDGANDYVSVVDTFAITKAITIALWTKPTDISAQGSFMSKRESNGGIPHWELRYKTDGKVWWTINEGSDWSLGEAFSVPTLTVGTWTHIGVTHTFGTTDYKIYMDGVAVSMTTSGTLTQVPSGAVGKFTIIGSPYLSAGYYYGGLIDDMRIYDRALSASEMTSIAAGVA